MEFTPVILSGGSGTRLWPVSRKNYPKQFCDLLDKPLQTLTIERLQKYGDGLLVTSFDLKTLTEKNIKENNLKISKVLYEPVGRNTAAAVALACFYLEAQGLSENIVGIFPSDAQIVKPLVLDKVLKLAVQQAKEGYVVTLGIRPQHPETGFGYIQVPQGSTLEQPVSVLKFHEKPTLDKAKSFLAEGDYFWNAGIFVFKVSKMIEHFKKHEPNLWQSLSELKKDLANLTEVYASLKSVSLDYAVIEKLGSNDLKCVPCDIGWSDLGSWDTVVENTSGNAKYIEVAAQGNAVFSKQNKKYGLIGCQDLIVVDTPDALVVCKKGESQKVKDLVEQIGAVDSKVITEHMFEHRPWGKFEILREESHYKSKIITVDPGQLISYQSHAKRSEHWVIVKGEGVVIINDKEIVCKVGDHVFVPMGAKHRIINRSQSPLEFIEVQVGTYFGEDDIVRYQDDYGRN